MSKRWIGLALVVAGSLVPAARAQHLPYTPPAPMPEPIPFALTPRGGPPPGFPGPGAGPHPAPHGGDPAHNIMSLPDMPNSFSDECWICDPKCFQLNVEYLLWWLRDSTSVPLVTTGSLGAPVPGALGNPGTRTLLGGDLDNRGFSGVRVSAACCICACPPLSAEGTFFILEQRTFIRNFVSEGGPGDRIITRPFFNPITETEDADPVALTNAQAGSLSVALRDRFLGAEANLRFETPYSVLWTTSLTVLAGVRFLSLDERLLFQENSQDLPVGAPFTTQRLLSDDFTTFNRFYGGQVGAEARICHGPFDLSVQGKVGYGYNRQVVRARGRTVLTELDTGLTITDNDQGLLVQPSNAGRHSRDRFSVVPELSVSAGVYLTDQVRLFAGYNFLYWTNVARAADQIDPVVNIQPLGLLRRELIPPARPAVLFPHSNFWAQGLTAGLAFSF